MMAFFLNKVPSFPTQGCKTTLLLLLLRTMSVSDTAIFFTDYPPEVGKDHESSLMPVSVLKCFDDE